MLTSKRRTANYNEVRKKCDEIRLSRNAVRLFNILPLEIKEKILITLPYYDIINYCLINKEATKICNDENFWRDKAKLEGIPLNLLLGSSLSISQRYGQLLKLYGNCLYIDQRLEIADESIGMCLITAVKYKDIPMIEYLLMRNPSQTYLLKSIDQSISMNYFDLTKMLLQLLKKDDLTDDDMINLSYTLLELIKSSQPELVIYIIKNLIDDDYYQHQSLLDTAENATLKDVKIMVENMNYNEIDFNDAIHYYIRNHNYEGILYLLKEYPGDKAELDELFTDRNIYIDLKTMKLFFEYGFDDYNTAFIYAMDNRDLDMIKWLLSTGNINLIISNGLISIVSDDYDTTDYNLEYIDKNIRDTLIRYLSSVNV